MSMTSSPALSQGTGIGASPIGAQNQPPMGLPSIGMSGGKSGLSDIGQALGQAIGPQVGFGFNPNTGDAFTAGGMPPPLVSPQPTTGGPDPFSGGMAPPPLVSPQPTTPFPNQQQPMTSGTGQLPPGFGALSPVDRSQIAPNVSIGFGPATGGVYGRDLSAAPRSGQLMGSMGSYATQPAPRVQPVNRYAPPMAPGVRPARPVVRNTRSQIR